MSMLGYERLFVYLIRGTLHMHEIDSNAHVPSAIV